MYDGVEIPELPDFRDNLEGKPQTYRHMNMPIADENGQMIVPSVFSWDEWAEMLKIVYAQSTMIDDAIGMILRAVDESGFADNTAVIWTSDHGDAFASHGGMFDKGSFMTEETIRIPLAVRIPGFRGSSDALVTTMDIPATILDIAGTGFRDSIDGKSLLPIIEGRADKLRDALMLESFGQGYRDMTKVKCLLEGPFKYCITENDIDEMYNLDKDPYEMDNLASRPECRAEAARLRAELVEMTAEGGEDAAWMR